MRHHNALSEIVKYLPLGIITIGLGSSIVYQQVSLNQLKKEILDLRIETASTTEYLSLRLSSSILELQHQAAGISNTLSSTQQNVDAVKNQIGGVEQTVGSISGTVGNLQKLSEVDPEILKKYSKVFFMSENYVPAHLAQIPSNYLYNEKEPEQFIVEGFSYLKKLLDDAKSSSVEIYVKSGYRSFGEQEMLKSIYKVTYGAGTANSFSADQGYSEHQLGTTVDFITTGLNGQLDGFDNTVAYQWLQNNAYRYGFTLSYPKGNDYYVYEPWHWRFVGIKLATYLHNSNINFYDLDQREIDKYLVTVYE